MVTAPWFSEALTNAETAILKENYPEDKLSEEKYDLILAEIMEAFKSIPRHSLLLLRFYRLKGRQLTYVCTNQQSGHWLNEAINDHRFGKGTMLMATDAKDLWRSIKMALKTWDKQLRDNEVI